MKDILERVINLIKKTGDRVIIVDQAGQSHYVVMDFDAYEKLVSGEAGGSLTNREMADKMDKINRDIALWREEAKKEETGLPPDLPVEEKAEEKETESQFYFEPVE